MDSSTLPLSTSPDDPAAGEDLLPLLEAVVNRSEMVLESLNDPAHADRPLPEGFREDLSNISPLARELYDWLHDGLAAAAPGPETSARRAFWHDAANRLNLISGHCQFLLDAVRDAADEPHDALWGAWSREVEEIHHLIGASAGALVRRRRAERKLGGGAADLAAADAPHEPIVPVRSPAGDVGEILVVDDSQIHRETLCRFLEKEGHRVHCVPDGRTALQRLQSEAFDLVLLDLLMPEMTGFQVMQELRRRGCLPHLPVIVLSGLDDTADVVRCVEMGAESFLSKPVQHRLLRANINACLVKRRLREQELSRFFTPQVARELLRHPERLARARMVEASVLFCDIRGFSAVCESQTDSDLTLCWLSDVMNELSEAVAGFDGVLVDYIGDELLAMWGAPLPQPNHAELACRAALAMLERLPELDRRWLGRIGRPTRVGIGINTGVAHFGNVGTPRRVKYGPLGNMVNLASRVQGATKFLRSQVLLTAHTRQGLPPELHCRRVAKVRVQNIAEPLDLYELFPPGASPWRELTERYEQALDHFEANRLVEANALLGGVLSQHPYDGPTLTLVKRVVEALLQPQQFTPVWELPGK